MTTNWQTFSGLIQGDISYTLRVSDIQKEYVDLALTAFSERWSLFDVKIEYRLSNDLEWKQDMDIIGSNAKINKNLLFGLNAEKYGHINLIRWNYLKDNVVFGDNIKIKITILPIIRNYSTSTVNHIISQVSQSGDLSFLNSSVYTKVIGINQSGQYICADSNSIGIKNEIDGEYIYKKEGFVNPTYACQIWNNNYIIVDNGNNQILELNFNLIQIEKSLSVNDPVFIDYSESNDLLLVTRKSDGIIEEYTWESSDGYTANYGEKVWASNDHGLTLSNPECATYKFNDISKIVVCDTENNSIIKYDKNYDTFETYFSFNPPNSNNSEFSILNEPYRAFWTEENIYIVEKQGKKLTFNIMDSSSSS